MAEFVPYIALSTLAFEGVAKVTQAVIRSQPAGRQYSVSTAQLSAYITSLIHSVVAVIGAVCILVQTASLHSDRVFAVDPQAPYLLAFSAGFFLYDLLDIAQRLKSFADFCYLVHHAICFALYATATVRPLCQCWALVFLLYEASTPFLSLQNLMRSMKLGTPTALSIIRGTFAVVFIVVRIILGTVASLYVCNDLVPLIALKPSHPELLLSFPRYSQSAHPHVLVPFLILLCCGVFLILNLYWGHLIILRARIALSSQPKKKLL